MDHGATVNVAMAGEVQEVLSVEELHHQMGHVAPEAARKMVSSRAIEGIDVDLTGDLKRCASCKYVKATHKPIKKS